MKKSSLILILIIIATVGISCAPKKGKYDGVSFDIEQLASNLAESVPFDDELQRIEDEAVSLAYNFGGIRSVVYAGSGATPEIIIIVECSGSGEAETAAGKIRDYLGSQSALFADYNPSQLPKIEDALCGVYGRWVICTVSAGNSAAEAVIDSCAEAGIKSPET